ncbi:hypothetical protein DFH11DRAFT_1688064 [Phellopilus nigrolimitatus]|nr:hypothetical protein DFH11DRAFT_1688064 [Phellopilus nigrolimitatus]
MSEAATAHDDARALPALPLKGDGSGAYRVHIIGNSGDVPAPPCSTLAAELAALLGAPAVHLDRLFWDPGWHAAPADEFRARIAAALAAAAASAEGARGWVVDGTYSRTLGAQLAGATDIIWLDPPLALYFARLARRTFARLLGRAPPCAPGCPERAREVFLSRASILWYALTRHARTRRREGARLRAEGVDVGGRVRRIGGWGRELADWKRAVAEMVRRE